MKKGFFKFFSPENSSKRLKIPTAYTDYKNGKLPRKVSLRDRFGNMWPIGVTKTGRNFHFQYGWEKFIKENTIEFGDFLTFDYDGNGVFDFKLLGTTGCEKKGAGGLKLDVKDEDEEEMNVEHQKSEVPKRKWPSDSSSYDDSDEDDEDYMVEEETEKTPRSKRRFAEEEEDDEAEVCDEETEEEEEEKENERAGTFKKKAPCSKAGSKRATARKVVHDYFGTDIFKSGRATQPKNPYFVTKIRAKRRDQLYLSIDVVRDYKLELPSIMTIRDPAGRKFETKLESWKDGRIWLHGGWRNLCRWNLVGKNDSCICEFVRGKGKEGLYLQVQVLYEGASSHPSKSNKYYAAI